MISLSGLIHQKTRSLTLLFMEDAQNNPKKCSYEDNAKFHSVCLSTTALSSASRFQRKWGVIENFVNLGKFDKYF
jgi:hypothetical protein